MATLIRGDPSNPPNLCSIPSTKSSTGGGRNNKPGHQLVAEFSPRRVVAIVAACEHNDQIKIRDNNHELASIPRCVECAICLFADSIFSHPPAIPVVI